MNDLLADLDAVLGQGGLASVVAFATAIAATLIATVPVRRLADRLGAVDVPGGRRIHARPTARLGGIALLTGMVAGVGAALFIAGNLFGASGDLLSLAPSVLIAGALVCAIGAWDDIRGISPAVKLAGLATAGALLVCLGVKIEVVGLPGSGRIELAWLAGPATLLWLMACANAFNLIDGVDGASTGVGMASSAALALLCLGLSDAPSGVLYAAVCGATAGFLFYNRHPASIFLGDSGSLMLGFTLAAVSAGSCTKRATALPLIAALLALSVPLLDTTQAFTRRFLGSLRSGGHRRVLRALRATAVADRQHIHHRLLSRGFSHRQVARVFSIVTLLTALSALLLVPSEGPVQALFIVSSLAGAYLLYRLAAVRAADRWDTEASEPAPGSSVLIPRSPPRKPVVRSSGRPGKRPEPVKGLSPRR